MREMSTFFQRGGLWVFAQLLLMGALVVCGIIFASPQRSGIVTGAGIVLLALSGAVALASALSLGRGLTPCLRPRSESRLVCSGVYSVVRHPIYTSVMAAGFGWALLRQSWPAFVVALLLVPFFAAKASGEERWLRAQFPEYAEYSQRVRRFIPWLY
jgi:protein-S-isoprenylcysteine O-methyltransferase Ste14